MLFSRVYNDTEESIIRNAIPQLLSFTRVRFQINTTELDILQNVLEQNDYFDMTVVMDEISQSCGDMFIYCMWNTRRISCLENFRRSFSQLGACCSFNYIDVEQFPRIYTRFSGVGTGLSILLNSQSQDARYSRTFSSGFKVLHILNQQPCTYKFISCFNS